MDFPDRFRGLRRFEELLQVLTKYELHYLFYKDFKVPRNSPKTEPEAIREVLEELGGGFVKLGQLLSLRPDLVPQAYSQEFSKLQDSVKPFPYAEAKKIIEESTGKKLKDIFSVFNQTPIAAASVGQVHKAKLKSGAWVAVKVRRPFIDKIFKQDLALMDMTAELIKKFHGTDIIDPEEIVAAFREYTAKELDYKEEAQALQKFYENFKETEIIIPKPNLELSTEKMLIMDFIEGIELKKIIAQKNHDEYKKMLATELFNSFLKQVLIDGTFHADLHPSNILVQTKNKNTYASQDKFSNKDELANQNILTNKNSPANQTRLAFLDFGIIGTLNGELRAGLLSLFIALIDKNLDGIVDAMIKMNFLSQDNKEIRKDMREMLSPYAHAGLEKINLPKLFTQSIKVARKHKIKVSRDYVLLGKAVLTVECVCAELNPNFNVINESKPFITRLMVHEYAPSQFLAKSMLKLEHAKELTLNIPSIVSKYFSNNEQQNKQIEELSAHIMKSETRMDKMIEKLILMFVTIIMLLSGILLLKRGPMAGDTSIFSIILFCMATAIFIAALTVKVKE